MSKIEILPKRCIACGICAALSPNVFDYYDTGIVKFIQTDDNTAYFNDVTDLKYTIKKCPTRAIRIAIDT